MSTMMALSTVSTGLLGWFRTEVEKVSLTVTELGYLTEDKRGSIGGTIPSVYTALAGCDTRGERTAALDGAIRGVIALGFAKIKNIKPLLIELIYKLDETYPVRLPTIEAATLLLLPCGDLVRDALNAMVRYAAINVTYFDTVPPKARLTEIKNRSWAVLGDPAKSDAIAKASGPVSSRTRPPQFAQMAEGVNAAKGGVCTTFAAAAATLLLEDRKINGGVYRVEYISAPKHCFCLLNRVDSQTNPDRAEDRFDIIPSCGDWNPEVIIIDPWAGAMGFHVISTVDTYPPVLKSMIGSELKKFYDTSWPAGD